MNTVHRCMCIAVSWVTIGVTTAAEPPPELARWFAQQNWVRDVPGPIVSLGAPGEFDDMHMFAPTVAHEGDHYQMWYCGSRGTPGKRVFRMGLATSSDGKTFEKYKENPVLQFKDGEHSILTPTLLRKGDGSVVRENGKLRIWFSSTAFGKTGAHTIHESTSADGIHWADPSPPLLENAYCPTVLKTADGYRMWYGDVTKRPWVIRHASSTNGRDWKPSEQPALILSQDWEAEVFVYPTVLQIDDVFLMWYGSYDKSIRREKTAVGFAVSKDGLTWYKHPKNPVMTPDSNRPWESNYVGSGCVSRLADGSYRYWYASRREPPGGRFDHLYFAINTAHWAGPRPAKQLAEAPEHVKTYLKRCEEAKAAAIPLTMPPKKGDVGILHVTKGSRIPTADVLEVIDGDNAIVRAWYVPTVDRTPAEDATFFDVWIHGVDTKGMTAGTSAKLPQVFHVTGNKTFGTTCGSRSMPLLEVIDVEPYRLRR